MATAKAHVIITGRVQGVFFRVETQRMAHRLGVNGWVRNRRDGTVEAVFQGSKTIVDQAIEWCGQGSPGARVTNVQVDWQPASDDLNGFEITY